MFKVLLLIIIVLSIFILVPKVAILIVPQKQNNLLKSYINEVVSVKNIDPQKYWEFREFYSPGTFTFKNSSINQNSIPQNIKPLLPENFKGMIFLTFDTKKFQSVDALIDDLTLPKITIPSQNILAKTNQMLLYKINNEYVLYFVLSNKDMQKANGFFDYSDKDKTITADKNWFNISVIEE